MPTKRGRPLSSDSVDTGAARLREQARRRMRLYRERQRSVAEREFEARSVEQLEQGEHIVNITSIYEEAAAATASQLGLRVQGLTLAQDFNNVREQEQGVDVDEGVTIYTEAATQRDNPVTVSPIQAQPECNVRIFQQFARRTSQRSIASSQRTTPGQRSPLDFFRSMLARQAQQSEDRTTSNSYEAVNSISAPTHIVEAPVHNATDAGQMLNTDSSNVSVEVTPPTNVDPDPIDKDSVFEFASHYYSDDDDGSSSGIEATPHEYMVERLFDQIAGGHHGCSPEVHAMNLSEHMQDAGDNHHGLSDVFNDAQFPTVLELNELITSERLVREETPTPSQWKSMFCGVSGQSSEDQPRNVCLHKEQTQAVEAQVAYDIDSFLGFARTLGVAKKGRWYQPAPRMKQNMTAGNHLEMRMHLLGEDGIEPQSRSQSAMLRDVPHFLLGRIVGAHDVTLHVLFPHMPVGRDKFVALTHEQLSRWVDGVYMPALHQFYDAHYLQHLPASFRHATANSKAHQIEGRMIETVSYQAQQSIGYHLQPEHLAAIWADVLSTIVNTPGYADFREPQLFFSAKGTKLQFKTSASRPDLSGAMDVFHEFFTEIMDLEAVELDRMYVDLGKEICPSDSHVSRHNLHVGEEPQVYAWKRCCLSSYLNWMYEGQPPPAGRGQNYYGQNMLYEATSMTSLTPRGSKQRAGGLIYSQFYGSVKEITDATKCFPFSNDGMEEMALDPHIRQGARNAAGGHKRDGKIVERAYLASQRRTMDTLRAKSARDHARFSHSAVNQC